MSASRVILLSAAGVLAVAAVTLTLLYRADMRRAYRNLDLDGLRTVRTSFGQISYIDEGEGEPVLFIHGISGGYDQGIATARSTFGSGFRLIAPSRFGYPGSDLPDRSDPEAQAAAFAELLDGLGIDKVIIGGASAGGTPTFSFLRLYPERVKAALFVSSGVPVLDYSKVPSGPPPAIYRNWVFWTIIRFFPGFLRDLFGVERNAFRTAGAEERRNVDELVRGVLPVSERKAGYLNDTAITNPYLSLNYDRYRLEEITVPVLFIQAENDPMTRYEFVKAAADRIPGARMLLYSTGGHILFGHDTKPAVRQFLREVGL